MRLENYFFVIPDADNGKVTLPDSRAEHICVTGNVYGRPGCPDGRLICTSWITKHQDNKVTTRSGKVYELGSKHPDYEELEKAIKMGIPILTNWKLHHRLDEGYQFSANGSLVCGKVVGQRGNFITLRNERGEERECLVIWHNLDFETQAMMMLTGEIAGISTRQLEPNFSWKTRPKLQLSS